jgi:hypothetical protein
MSTENCGAWTLVCDSILMGSRVGDVPTQDLAKIALVCKQPDDRVEVELRLRNFSVSESASRVGLLQHQMLSRGFRFDLELQQALSKCFHVQGYHRVYKDFVDEGVAFTVVQGETDTRVAKIAVSGGCMPPHNTTVRLSSYTAREVVGQIKSTEGPKDLVVYQPQSHICIRLRPAFRKRYTYVVVHDKVHSILRLSGAAFSTLFAELLRDVVSRSLAVCADRA